jgi:hypothetical protein
MKKIILLAIAVQILAAGCNDFLDIPVEGSLPATAMDYSKAENIFQPVSAAYATLRSGNIHGFPYIGVGEIASDNADKGSTPSDNPAMAELDAFAFDERNALIAQLWLGCYDIVSAANNAIVQMPLFEEAQQNASNKLYARQCAGEAKVLRAYAYFNLVRIFGNVPIIDGVMTAEEIASLRQATPADTYAFIEKDLREAIEVLPEQYTADWAGRITKYTAMGIKAKAHLYEGKFDSVASLTDRIIASGRFGLLDDFREVFAMSGENSRESLFEIQSSTLGKTSGEAAYVEYGYYQGPKGNTPANMQGWGFCTPSDDLIAFYNGRQEVVRPATTLLYRGTTTPEGDVISEACSNPVYNGKAYTPSAYNKWSYNGYSFDQNIRILRYPDVLLMFAEAVERGASVSPTSGMTAQEAVNKVRRRAGLEELGAPTLEDILAERRAELAMEEDRFFDIVRTGQTALLTGHGFKAGKNELFPIPYAQRQLNPNLQQNPGY